VIILPLGVDIIAQDNLEAGEAIDSTPRPSTLPITAPAETTPPKSPQENCLTAEAATHRKHHDLPRMLLHREKPNRRRVALPVPEPSEPLTPSNSVKADREAAGVQREESKSPMLEEGHRSQANFMRQVLGWVNHERQRQRERAMKREAKKAEKKGRQSPKQVPPQVTEAGEIPTPGCKNGVLADENLTTPAREGSDSPESTSSAIGASRESLNRLEQIAKAGLAASSSSLRLSRMSGAAPKTPPRQLSRKALRPRSRSSTLYTSDTDVAPDGDVIAPGCEVTLGIPEKIGWDEFKEEVLRLTHTLRCKGWRKIALEQFKELEIKRISGALTNAVYMVSPPPLPPPPPPPPPVGNGADGVPTTASTSTKKPA